MRTPTTTGRAGLGPRTWPGALPSAAATARDAPDEVVVHLGHASGAAAARPGGRPRRSRRRPGGSAPTNASTWLRSSAATATRSKVRVLRSRGRGGAVRGVRSRASEPCTLVTGRACAAGSPRACCVVAHDRSPSWWVSSWWMPGRRSAWPGRIRSGSSPTTSRLARQIARHRSSSEPRAGVGERDGGQRVAGAYDVGAGGAVGVGRRRAVAMDDRRDRPLGEGQPGEQLAAVAAGGDGRGSRCRPRRRRRTRAAPGAGCAPLVAVAAAEQVDARSSW